MSDYLNKYNKIPYVLKNKTDKTGNEKENNNKKSSDETELIKIRRVK